MNRYNVTIAAGYNLIIEAESPAQAKTLARADWDAHGMTEHRTVTARKVDDGAMPGAVRRFLG